MADVGDAATEEVGAAREIAQIPLVDHFGGQGYGVVTTGRQFLGPVLTQGSHAEGADKAGLWLRTGDLGVYLESELYITGRIKDLVIVDGRNHYPQDLEATAAHASAAVRVGAASWRGARVAAYLEGRL